MIHFAVLVKLLVTVYGGFFGKPPVRMMDLHVINERNVSGNTGIRDWGAMESSVRSSNLMHQANLSAGKWAPLRSSRKHGVKSRKPQQHATTDAHTTSRELAWRQKDTRRF